MAYRWLAVAAIIFTAGCGLEKPEPPAERETSRSPVAAEAEAPAASEPEFLTLQDLRRYDAGDPRRVVLDFWFAIQYRDLLSAYEMLTTEFRSEFSPTLRRFGTYVMADHGRWLTKPSMLFVRRIRDRATVAIRYPLRGGGAERSAFSLEREGGRWKIAYDFYLSNRLLGK